MGTSVAPIVANLHLALKFDSKLTAHKLYRYIDDVLLLTTDAFNIIEFQEVAHPLSITFNINKHQIDFLDITLAITSSVITSKVFQKPMNRYDYIPKVSHQPIGVVKGFIIGELIRYIRLCSYSSDYKNYQKLFFSRLIKRGFSYKFLYKFLSHPKLINLYNNRYKKTNNLQELKICASQKNAPLSDKPDIFYFVIRYSDQPKILHTWRKTFTELESKISEQTDQKCSIKISYKKNQSVGQITAKTKLTENQLNFISQSESTQKDTDPCEKSTQSDKI